MLDTFAESLLGERRYVSMRLCVCGGGALACGGDAAMLLLTAMMRWSSMGWSRMDLVREEDFWLGLVGHW